MADITDLSGVGESKAERLRDVGFETIEDIAAASPGDIAGIDGFGETLAAEIHEAALDEISVEEEIVEIDEEDLLEDFDEFQAANEPDVEADEADSEPEEPAVDDDDTPAFYTLHLDVDDALINHVIAGLAEVEISKRRQKHDIQAEKAQALAFELRNYNGSIEVDEEQYHMLYAAVNQRAVQYRPLGGIAKLVGEMQSLAESLRESRDNDLF